MNILSNKDEFKILESIPIKDLKWDRVSSKSPGLLELYDGCLFVASLQPNPINVLYRDFLLRGKPDPVSLWERVLSLEGIPPALKGTIKSLSAGAAEVRPVAPPKYITEINLRDREGKLTVRVLLLDQGVQTDNFLSITYPNGTVKTLNNNDLGKPFMDSCGNGVSMFVQGNYSSEDLNRCRDMRVHQLEQELCGLHKDIKKKEEKLALWRDGEIS